MRYIYVFWAAIQLFAASAYGQFLTGDQPSLQAVQSNLSAMPLSFTENRGQFGNKAMFKAEAGGATFYFCRDEVAYLFTRNTDQLEESLIPGSPGPENKFNHPRYKQEATLIKVRFVGANPDAEIIGEDRQAHNNNYFLGNDPAKWRTDVPNWSSVIYRNIYPGIDLKYHGDSKGMKYDFIVNPGADISQIRVRYDGIKDLAVTANGDLEAQTSFGPIHENIPSAYQETRGGKREVTGRYIILEPGVFGFEVEGYNPSHPLVIDPTLIYSTYLGGSGDEEGYGIAVDGSGNAYITGYTSSTNFPTQNPYQTHQTYTDAFVTKLSLSGNSLIYSTYLGGNDSDFGYAIAVDGSGNAYMTGFTWSTNFPTQNPYQTDQPYVDAFVTKLSPSGNSLIYSTYLGGSGQEGGRGIAVDGSRNAYVTGFTGSVDFPTHNPYQTYQGPTSYWDAFVTKLSPSGNSLAYSTYLGGNNDDRGFGIAVDASGNAYITGETQSTNFPTQNPYQTDQATWDAFVTKLSPSGNSLVYSTYLGGNNEDRGRGIAVDGSGNAYLTGFTGSSDFPTANPYDATFNGGSNDAFAAKFDSAGNSLIYSTYLGGSGDDECNGIAVDGLGQAYVTGYTNSADFPTQNPFQTNQDTTDVFVTQLSPEGNSLVYSTYLGGNYVDEGFGIAVDSSGNSYVTGYTSSTNFPIQNPYQTDQPLEDAFVTKLGPVGLIWGIVTETDGSTPIVGVLIKSLQNGSEIARDTTDLSGLYDLANLLPGFYDVEASKIGYVSQTQQHIEVIAGQTDTVNFQLAQEIPPCSYIPGDINGNSQVNGIDIVYAVNYLKGGPNPPVDCFPSCPLMPNPFYAAGDVNGNCAFNGIDVTFFVRYLKGQVPSLLYCPDCPPAGLNPPKPAVEPIKTPMLKSGVKLNRHD
jgi:hypothetical protein